MKGLMNKQEQRFCQSPFEGWGKRMISTYLKRPQQDSQLSDIQGDERNLDTGK